MRYAVLTDVHGDVDSLQRVLEHIARQAVDQVISMGDVFECKVSKRQAEKYEFTGDIAEVVDADPRVEVLLRGALLLRGNQEERIASLVPRAHLPDWTRPILHAPLEHRTDFAVYGHGHRLPWRETQPGVWSPAEAPFPGRALIHGHHHRSALRRLPQARCGRDAEPVLVPVRHGEPIHLAPGARYIVNVGPVAKTAPERGPSPAWAVIDEDAATVTHHHCEEKT
ncbi:metallophosphoesterase [Streptomyces sp. NPDC048606]|uniref:metallophosphoesterase n=1 Tax=Streptomyces sp. NPDC048606 TaxID=3154726 RepID=UPI003413C19F